MCGRVTLPRTEEITKELGLKYEGDHLPLQNVSFDSFSSELTKRKRMKNILAKSISIEFILVNVKFDLGC